MVAIQNAIRRDPANGRPVGIVIPGKQFSVTGNQYEGKRMTEAVTNRPTFLMYDGVGSSTAALSLPREVYLERILNPLYRTTAAQVAAKGGKQLGEPPGMTVPPSSRPPPRLSTVP